MWSLPDARLGDVGRVDIRTHPCDNHLSRRKSGTPNQEDDLMRPIVTMLVLAASTVAIPMVSVGSATAQTAPAKVKYTTTDTEIGTLLDNPATHAILDKYLPGVTGSDQIDMARTMTLKAIQSYAADQITDAKLAQIDAEFAKLN